MQIKQVTVAATLWLLSTAYGSALPQQSSTSGDKVGDIIDDAINGGGQIVNDIINFNWPTIQVPNDVKDFVNNIDNALTNAPEQLWQDIHNNQWPQQTEDWIKSLPQDLQDDARNELRKLADEKLGTNTQTNNGDSTNQQGGAAPSITTATFAVSGVAAIVAFFMAF